MMQKIGIKLQRFKNKLTISIQILLKLQFCLYIEKNPNLLFEIIKFNLFANR